MKPKLPSFEAVVPYLKSMDERRVYTNRGYLVQTLEQRFAKKLHINESKLVLCANATMGLQGLSELSSSLEFTIPSFTFPATGLAAQKSGKPFSLLDIDPVSWEIDISQMKPDSALGVVTVAPFGKALEINKYQNIDNLIVDAAASLGYYMQNPVKLNMNQSFVFSLHATKVLGIGCGGLVIFGDLEKANQFRSWINFGFAGSRDSKIFGINAKMSEMQAAYGHAVLDNWETEKKEWLIVKEKAKQVENNLPKLFNHNLEMGISPYWLSYSTPEIKAEIVKTFKKLNIETRDWWSRGLHNMPAFSKYNDKHFPITEKVADSSIGLPFFREMKDSDFDRIHEALSKVDR
jgi:dTDP-4-amino-4,6-dideoxygalactose transaminase